MKAIVLLSGGMDSCVALFHTLDSYAIAGNVRIDGLFYYYGQRASNSEHKSAELVWECARDKYKRMLGNFEVQVIPNEFFAPGASILGDTPVDSYKTVTEAVRGTQSDKSYIPLRNGLFVMLAAHRLAAKIGDDYGLIVTGIRGRPATASTRGFPDCTADFTKKISDAVREGSGKDIIVTDPLNHFAGTRTKTIQLAMKLDGCLDALEHTVSCFHGKPVCGECLPCLRRAQAFEHAGISDPALS